MIDDTRCFLAWRRSEAWAVPMTQEGIDMAGERYKEFKKGYIAGINAAAFEMEQVHRENKHIHKFFLLAHNYIRGLLK